MSPSPESPATDDRPRVHDLRMPILGAATWLGGIAATHSAALAGAALVGAGLLAAAVRHKLVTAALLLACAAVAGTLLRHQAVVASPLPDLAAHRATADLTGAVVSDPRRVEGQWGDLVVVRLRVSEVLARGQTLRLGATVVVLGDPAWSTVTLGQRVRTTGRLASADDPDEAAVLTGARPPVRIRGPDPWWRGSAAVRAAIREAVAHRPPAQAGLVPALVDGDDAGLPAQVEEDFRTTGLTHLTAVSGTNLTLVVGALLLCARAVGVRRRWLTLVGLLGVVGFVLLARTEPSVLRAAAMGVVGLFAFGPDGRRRGLRALGVALAALVLVQPSLATSAGFALSVLATAGIVLGGPPLSAALARWLPRGLAEAIAVPTAAQLACTPVVAVLSGQVSLVAIVANLLAGPVVGPATVLGLLAGLVGLVSPVTGRLLGTGASWCVGWIVEVAERGAALPGASIGWGTGAVAIAVLSVLCLALVWLLPRVMGRPGLGAGLIAVLLLVVLGVPGRIWSAPSFGWPPAGWVLVSCDVGQGDAHVIAVGPGSAIVVDAGPDPDAVDGCLDRLGVRRIPLLVLTHFHADHVLGLEGVLRDRRVDLLEVTPVRDPPAAVADVERLAGAAGAPVRIAAFGSTRRYDGTTLQVLHPDIPVPVPGAGDGSSANDASVILLVETAGIRILLTGDVEPPGQAEVAALTAGLDIDVLKVPHHGSVHQDFGWLVDLRPEVALVSVGADNDYGHPAPRVLSTLTETGAEVLRTDTGGDLAVVVEADGRMSTRTRE